MPWYLLSSSTFSLFTYHIICRSNVISIIFRWTIFPILYRWQIQWSPHGEQIPNNLPEGSHLRYCAGRYISGGYISPCEVTSLHKTICSQWHSSLSYSIIIRLYVNDVELTITCWNEYDLVVKIQSTCIQNTRIGGSIGIYKYIYIYVHICITM